ncbi:response regulator transcription factor [Cohnella yongneupensis]|uniref:Response regulator n=1 Tax=Cohnella yongneupensis TaxID=425006 RepID=A0ABW0QWM3_9BACL
MNRVMLIEDEPPILHMVKQMIESSSQGFVVTQTAYNGRKALKLLAESDPKPDLIVTDIRMPVMDGLQFMKELTARGYDIPCVVLSGYSDFDYAREALLSNACDYLLKPVKEDHLEKALGKAASLLRKRRNESERLYLKKALRLPDDSERRAADPGYPYYQLLLIRRGSYWSKAWDERLVTAEDWFCWNEETLKATGNGVSSWRMSGITSNEKIIVRGLNDPIGETLSRQNVESMLAEWKSSGGMAAIPISMAVSEAVTPERMAATLRAIRDALAGDTMIGQSRIWVQGDPRKPDFVLTTDLEQSCRTLAKSADYRSFEKTMVSWTNNWMKESYGQLAVESLMTAIVRLFQVQWRLGDAPGIAAFDANELLSGSLTLDEAVAQFCEYMRELYGNLARSRPERSAKDLIDNVRRYLDEHYMEPIGSDDLQDVFGYHKTYIANVFSDVVGIPPGKYLTKLRIDKAITLLNDRKDLSLRQIAEQVGYVDSLYFSKVFKIATGLSPKEYKERRERDDESESS